MDLGKDIIMISLYIGNQVYMSGFHTGFFAWGEGGREGNGKFQNASDMCMPISRASTCTFMKLSKSLLNYGPLSNYYLWVLYETLHVQ